MHGVDAIDQDHERAIFAFYHLNGLLAGGYRHEDSRRGFNFLDWMSGRILHCERSWFNGRVRGPTQMGDAVKIVVLNRMRMH